MSRKGKLFTKAEHIWDVTPGFSLRCLVFLTRDTRRDGTKHRSSRNDAPVVVTQHTRVSPLLAIDVSHRAAD